MAQITKNSDFILNSTEKLSVLNDAIAEIIPEKLRFYKKLFKINDFRKIKINLFDNLDDFRVFIYDLRGEKDSLPSYAIGTFDKGMINLYINSEKIDISHIVYKISHELFHIMYQELVWEKENKERITWFDEGMAKLFSGESEFHQNDGKFDEFLVNFKEKNKEFPDLNTLSHGSNFETNTYSGYMQSFLAVKYLYDTLGDDDFCILMHDTEQIKSLAKDIIPNALNYYKTLIKQGKTASM